MLLAAKTYAPNNARVRYQRTPIVLKQFRYYTMNIYGPTHCRDQGAHEVNYSHPYDKKCSD